MKIAIIAPPDETVPPFKYGGIELVIFNLVNSLSTLGHDVTLVASGDSKSSAQLKSLFPNALRTFPLYKDRDAREIYQSIAIGKDLQYLKEQKYDIVHNHTGWRLLSFAHLIDAPVITTLHGPLDVPHQKMAFESFSDANYVSISLSQRKPLPNIHYVANVYNGIDVEKFTYFPKPKDYFAFLGRMSPEKGPVQAIQIAKNAGVRLIMAAKVDAVDQLYFDTEVKPLIDNEQIQFIGEVDHPAKVELLGNAQALIAPIQWEEPFGLFFVEAMACGTPVITMNRGSAPEIIIDKKTGFLCSSIEEAALAVKSIGSIDRKTCFDHAQQHFSAQAMCKGYVNAYREVIQA